MGVHVASATPAPAPGAVRGGVRRLALTVAVGLLGTAVAGCASSTPAPGEASTPSSSPATASPGASPTVSPSDPTPTAGSSAEPTQVCDLFPQAYVATVLGLEEIQVRTSGMLPRGERRDTPVTCRLQDVSSDRTVLVVSVAELTSTEAPRYRANLEEERAANAQRCSGLTTGDGIGRGYYCPRVTVTAGRPTAVLNTVLHDRIYRIFFTPPTGAPATTRRRAVELVRQADASITAFDRQGS